MKLSRTVVLLLPFSLLCNAENVSTQVDLINSFNTTASGGFADLYLTDSIGIRAESSPVFVNHGGNISVSSENKKNLTIYGGEQLLENKSDAHTSFSQLGYLIVESMNGYKSGSSNRYGCLSLQDNSSLSLSGNDYVYLRNNAVKTAAGESSMTIKGGALYATKQVGNISFDKNGIVRLDNNQLKNHGSYGSAWGGAISIENLSSTTAARGILSFSENQMVSICSNSIEGAGNSSGGGPSGQGGAINLGQRHLLNISANTGVVSISDNYVVMHNTAKGGAVYATNAVINIDGNQKEVLINGNYVENTSSSSGTASGGAIQTMNYGAEYTNSISDNSGKVSICRNYVKSANAGTLSGGAFHINNNTYINNNVAGVQISDNYILSTSDKTDINAGGGAFNVGDYRAELSICNNGNVEISGNYISVKSSEATERTSLNGGAIYTTGTLRIEGNEEVVFKGNYIQGGNSVRLNSIQMEGAAALLLSAKTGRYRNRLQPRSVCWHWRLWQRAAVGDDHEVLQHRMHGEGFISAQEHEKKTPGRISKQPPSSATKSKPCAANEAGLPPCSPRRRNSTSPVSLFPNFGNARLPIFGNLQAIFPDFHPLTLTIPCLFCPKAAPPASTASRTGTPATPESAEAAAGQLS